MKNPLSRARSRRTDGATDALDTSDTPLSEPWAAYEPTDAGAPDDPSPEPAVPALDVAGVEPGIEPRRGDGDGDGGPSRTERLGRLLAVSNRAYLVVAAVALLLGPSAGASARAHLASSVPRPEPVAVAEPADPGRSIDDMLDDELPAVDDGRRRYLVALEPTTGATTTARPTTASTMPSATTTTAATTAVPKAPSVPVSLPPPPFPVTVLPGEETQWVDVVRVDGSRVAVLLPVRYLQLVREGDAARGTYPVDAGRTLVRDRDGRYWATAVDGMDPALFELAGQLPPPTTTIGRAADDTAGHATDATDDAHDTTSHDTTSHDTASPETTEHAMGAEDMGAEDTGAHDTGAQDTTGHEATGHDTATTAARRATTFPTIARSTTTTLSPAPPALIEPVPLADRELAIVLASLAGVEEVRALGSGVFAVIGILDPADLEAVPGVASVREDTLWTSTHLRR